MGNAILRRIAWMASGFILDVLVLRVTEPLLIALWATLLEFDFAILFIPALQFAAMVAVHLIVLPKLVWLDGPLTSREIQFASVNAAIITAATTVGVLISFTVFTAILPGSKAAPALAAAVSLAGAALLNQGLDPAVRANLARAAVGGLLCGALFSWIMSGQIRDSTSFGTLGNGAVLAYFALPLAMLPHLALDSGATALPGAIPAAFSRTVGLGLALVALAALLYFLVALGFLGVVFSI